MTILQVEKEIKQVLCDALGVDEDEIKPTSNLMLDLGAESIDFLDITYRLKKKFSIKIPRGELFLGTSFYNPEFEYVDLENKRLLDLDNKRLTVKGLNKLRGEMPFIDVSRFNDGDEIKVADLFTVDTLKRYICSKLGIQA